MSDVKRLLLLRHAKSSWDDPSLADHDRPLAPRGRKASKVIGSYLRDEQIRADVVLCSSARRARETLELAGVQGEAQVERGLYGASVDQLLGRLRRLPDELDTAMLIGHNPAIQELAAGLVAPTSELAERKYPTGALASLAFTGPWSALERGQAELVAFVTPKALG